MNEKVRRTLFELMRAVTQLRSGENLPDAIKPYIERANAALLEVNAPTHLIQNLLSIRNTWLAHPLSARRAAA
ncbi:MAG: hypothetical protein KatS3mg038_1002 [Candidatus Kapaibacterium sp.]|nr:MAG: hypothetical protein KatS3mg038_1002 [Candidatus Kapabacteria bacterium]